MQKVLRELPLRGRVSWGNIPIDYNNHTLVSEDYLPELVVTGSIVPHMNQVANQMFAPKNANVIALPAVGINRGVGALGGALALGTAISPIVEEYKPAITAGAIQALSWPAKLKEKIHSWTAPAETATPAPTPPPDDETPEQKEARLKNQKEADDAAKAAAEKKAARMGKLKKGAKWTAGGLLLSEAALNINEIFKDDGMPPQSYILGTGLGKVSDGLHRAALWFSGNLQPKKEDSSEKTDTVKGGNTVTYEPLDE